MRKLWSGVKIKSSFYISGDTLVASGGKNNQFQQLTNFKLTLAYPSPGQVGAYLTYVIINCDQSSDTGDAYVSSGGINSRAIQIVIEAKSTTYFNYLASFYGTK